MPDNERVLERTILQKPEGLVERVLDDRLPSRYLLLTEGDFVRVENQVEVYRIEGGKRRLIPDEATLASLGGTGTVKVRPLTILWRFPLGEPYLSVNAGNVSQEPARIRAYIASVPTLPQVPEYSRASALPSQTQNINGVDYTFASQQVQLARKFEDIAFLDPPQSVYPGALLQGKALASNSIAPIQIARAGGTITIATELVEGEVTTRSVRVADASLATVNQARVDLLNAIKPEASAGAYQLYSQTARTEAHGLIGVGLAVNVDGISADAKVKYASREETSTVMMRVRQLYYTVVFEPEVVGVQPAFFGQNVTLADVQGVTGMDNPPVYVAQASYGRELLIIATAHVRKSELEKAVKGKYQETVSGSFTSEWDSLLSAAQVSVLQRGGIGMDPQLVRLADPPNDLTKYLEQGKHFSLQNPGTLISFQARYLANNQLASIGAIVDYNEVVQVSAANASARVTIGEGPNAFRRVPVRDAVGRDILIRRGDYVSITAYGEVWAGILLTGKHGPDGWPGPGWRRNYYPVPGADAFSLIAGFSGNSWNGWFQVGSSSSFPYGGEAGETVRLFLGLNDDNVNNGSGTFNVRVEVQRRDAMQEYPGAEATA